MCERRRKYWKQIRVLFKFDFPLKVFHFIRKLLRRSHKKPENIYELIYSIFTSLCLPSGLGCLKTFFCWHVKFFGRILQHDSLTCCKKKLKSILWKVLQTSEKCRKISRALGECKFYWIWKYVKNNFAHWVVLKSSKKVGSTFMLPIAISMKSFFLDHTRTKLNNLRNRIEFCVNRIKLYMEQYFGYQLLEKSGIYISAHRIKNDSLCVKKTTRHNLISTPTGGHR